MAQHSVVSRSVLLCAALLAHGTVLRAQTIGDSLRIKSFEAPDWYYARLLGSDSASLRLWSMMSERVFRRSEVMDLEVWHRKNAALEIPLSAAAGAFGWWLGSRGNNYRPLTGSRDSDVVIAAGLSAVLGAIVVLAQPGRWQRVRVESRQPA